MSILYIVGTPIGNLEDITFRALSVLKDVDLIAAEDTRHTRILLDRYGIIKPLTSYHKFNVKEKTRYLISEVKRGINLALVSDAGMPGISDPGYELVKEAINNGIKIIPIPNTSALIVALSASGICTDRFVFEGFLPAKTSDRKKILEQLKSENRTIVLYEAPHRLIKTLIALKGSLGDRNICVARELTKKYEEFSRGNISQQIDKYSAVKPKGEFVLVIEASSVVAEQNIEDVESMLADLLRTGMTKKDAVKFLSKNKKIAKNKLYKIALGS